MPKILIVSHSPLLTTGYGRVTRMLAAALDAAGHRITVLGLGYKGESHAIGYRLLSWPLIDDHAPLAAALSTERPDILITIGDPWMFPTVAALPQRTGVTWIAYFPVDGFPLPADWKAWIAAADVPAVFCNWTADVVARDTGRRPHVVYHGVDTATFAPADKTHAKSRVGVDGRFVVGCVATNQQRKNLPALVKAFAAFAAGKPDVTLYLHTQIAGYWDIEALVNHHGIEPKTRATLNLDPQRGVDDPTLATVYNAFDCFVLPTMAEGFGLPIIESQACGVPALVTDFSSCSELLPDPFCRLRVTSTLVMARNFEQAVVDESDITAKLNRLYADRAELKRLGDLGHAFVQQFQWPRVCAEFVALVAAAHAPAARV